MGSTLVCGYIGSQRSTPPVSLLCWNWKSRANPVVCGYPGSKERVIHSFLCFFNNTTPPPSSPNGILYSHNISTTLAILSSRGEKRKKEKIIGLAKENGGPMIHTWPHFHAATPSAGRSLEWLCWVHLLIPCKSPQKRFCSRFRTIK